jgi:regulator of replication initiation timing
MAKSQRLSAKDTAEVEAYNRARAMDLQTIKRQDEEIADLTKDCEALRKRLALSEKENEDMRIIIRALRRRGSEENHG